MPYAMGPRREIGARTIFNILGPLTNPAGAQIQILGVYRKDLTEVLAAVLGKLGSQRALVVHGEDSLDEITTTGTTYISEWFEGKIVQYTIHPEDFGLPACRLEDLRGATAQENARIILDLLQGKRSPKRDIVHLNAGAALYATGTARSIAEGIELAKKSINDGKAMNKLKALIEYSNNIKGSQGYRTE